MFYKIEVSNGKIRSKASIVCESGCDYDTDENPWVWYDESRQISSSKTNYKLSGAEVAGLAIGSGVLGLLVGVGARMLAVRKGYNLYL